MSRKAGQAIAAKSMTGFGRGVVDRNGKRIVVEISGVNRKQLDIRLHCPKWMSAMEADLLRAIKRKVQRGSLHVNVTITSTNKQDATRERIDQEQALAWKEALSHLADQLSVKDDISLEALLALPGVMIAEEGQTPDIEIWQPLVERALTQALKAFEAMRLVEGRELGEDLLKRLKRLRMLQSRVAKRSPQTVKAYQQSLLARLQKMNLVVEVDSSDLAREIAIYADRCDVSEELVRLSSHFDQVESQLSARAPAGRTLDFLCQEMLREMNTIGSKANDVKIIDSVVAMKSELESVREQVQNIE